MHGRIYELALEPDECGCMTEDDFNDDVMFVGPIADYVAMVDDVEQEIEDFAKIYEKIFKVENSGLTDNNEMPIYKVTIVDKAEFFKHRFQKFYEKACQLAKMTTDQDKLFEHFMDNDFSDDPDATLSVLLSELNTAFDNELDAYTCADGMFTCTISTFLRDHSNGDEFYISNVFDYHV